MKPPDFSLYDTVAWIALILLALAALLTAAALWYGLSGSGGDAIGALMLGGFCAFIGVICKSFANELKKEEEAPPE